METDRSSMLPLPSSGKLYFTDTGILSFCLVCYTKPGVGFDGNKMEDARGVSGKMNFTKRQTSEEEDREASSEYKAVDSVSE